MDTEQLDLWQRVERFPLDEPQTAHPFTARLAKDNGWSRAFALRVAEEYKRFAYLCVASGHPCTPSDAVDQAWHLHLIHTRSYWEAFCGETLRQPLHHGPTKGGEQEDRKFHGWYARTLESYRRHFGEPPADIWPPAEGPVGQRPRFERVDRASHWVVPKPRRRPSAMTAALLGAGGLAVAGCGGAISGQIPVLDWSGPEFLLFYATAFVAVLGHATWQLSAWGRGQEARAARTAIPEDVYEAAALADGAERMAQTAVVRLADTGALKLDGVAEKRLSVVASAPVPAHSVEQAVLAQLRTAGPLAPIAAVRLAAGSPELAKVLARCPEADTRLGRPSCAVLVPMTVLAAIGVAKVCIGLSRERPVGFLVLMLVGTALTLLALQVARMRARSWRQRLGDQARARGTTERVRPLAPGENHAAPDLAWTAALCGVGALGGTVLADYAPLLVPPPKRGPAGSDGAWTSTTSCGSGSGGGDSGGGGGGSGCGGCGGGGGD